MDHINEQLMQLKQEKYLQEKYTRRLEQLRNERALESQNGSQLKLQLEKEMKDVDKLEGVSLTGFFLMISGKKEERLEKEKEEAYKAKVLYEETQKKLSELDMDIQAIQNKLSSLGDVDERLRKTLLQKEQLIHETDPALSNLLHNLNEQKVTWKMELKELEEAIEAAAEAERALQDADAELTSAANWGFMDMAGGGLLSTHLKRSHMDDAQELLHSAQYYLKRLQSELDDLGKEITSNLEVSDFLHIADYFFDNIFSDWMVQEKITTSAAQVNECLERLEELQVELKTEMRRAQSELQKVEEERQSFLQ
jgi:hypothetical protein